MKNRKFFPFRIATGLVVMLATAPLPAAEKDEYQKLKESLLDLNAYNADHWIYNDLDAARAEARRTGKPIFVTFRCVPCNACKSFDAEVANGSEVIKKLAREKFVSLRQVEMKGVDLNQFQFDHDLNWAAMFINADGAIYARYGTQSAEGPDAYNSIESLEKTMQRVLKLHEKYPANRSTIVGKRGKNRSYSTALEMPGMERKEKLRGPTKRDNCIHCHMIHDAENIGAYRDGTFTQDMLWRYPLPDNLGIEIDPADGLRIKAVAKGSPADEVGLGAGDEIFSVDGQRIVSIADFQWVLHNLPNKPVYLKIFARRNQGRERELTDIRSYTLRTKPGWKQTDISWRGSMWSVPPRLRIWMPKLKSEELEKAGLPPTMNAVKAKWINTKEKAGREAKKAGLRQNEIVVAVDGNPLPETSQQFSLYVKLNFKPGDDLPMTVWRNGKRVELKIPLFE
jgi:serine protease Do